MSRISSTGSALSRVALGIVLSLVAGVVVAGLAFPVLGGAGLLAKAGADDFLRLPDQLQTPALAQRSRILDAKGNVLATLFSENRVPVRLAAIPPLARQALIAIEDSRFYDHNGIDGKGTLRALAHNSASGSVQQGGSTITQQYVKNTLLEAAGTRAEQDAARGRTKKRKLQEARYALALEKKVSKDTILEGYFNIAYYGNGVYGIGTAASHYYSKPVQALDLAQGALLAGMVQNPRGYDPVQHPKAAVERRNTVLARMAQLGYITDQQKAVAQAEGLALRVTTVKSGCEAPGVRAPFFCDYVRRYLEDGPAGAPLGQTRQDRQERLLGGGLTIRTTLDPQVQAAAQASVDAHAPSNDPSGVAAVSDSVEPGTGAVKAMAVDRPYGDKAGQTKVNYAIGGTLGFQAGSTFKVFVLARALQMGIPVDLTLYSPPTYCPKAFPYPLPGGRCPANAEEAEGGTFDLVRATWDSVNTYYIQLEERTGLVTPPALAESLGLRVVDPNSFSGKPFSRAYPAFVLGGQEVSPLAMAAAYAAFAAHGLYCAPSPVASITDSTGHAIALTQPPCSQALEKGVADTVTSILRGVIDGPDPNRTGIAASIGRPAAGKTGTTNSSKAAWFVGYTPQLSTAVWVGKPTPAPLLGVRIGGQYFRQVYGGTVPAAIWQQTMSGALKGVPPLDLAAADSSVANGDTSDVPDVEGQPLDAAEQLLRSRGFNVVIGFRTSAAPIPAGAVAYTVPGAGSSAAPGTTVTLHASNGHYRVRTRRTPQPVIPGLNNGGQPSAAAVLPTPRAGTTGPARGSAAPATTPRATGPAATRPGVVKPRATRPGATGQPRRAAVVQPTPRRP